MATLVLQAAGTAIGSFLGGPVGAAIGSAVGGMAGSYIDRSLMGGEAGRTVEGPRLSNHDAVSAQEGAPIPRIYGRVRVGGQVIWATEFEEERKNETSGASGGKSTGSGGGTTSLRYNYYANAAIGLCEGPIAFVRRIWADGKPLDLASVNFRFYPGSEDQMPDPLIVAKQQSGAIPAFRGLAYIVFERFSMADYGNRLPQFSFELVRPADTLPNKIRAINLTPGATEFGYETIELRENFGFGASRALNRSQWTHPTDWDASLDSLTATLPHLERATLVSTWFGDDLRVGHCTLRPKTERTNKTTLNAQWGAAGLTRATALAVSQVEDRPAFGGSPSDASVIRAIEDLKARGLKVTLHPFIMLDIPLQNTLPNPYSDNPGQPAYPWRGRITCDPAPGRTGSPEGTPAIGAEIAAFFGSAQAGHFTLSGETVIYSGPNEWSFRRMVLHHAMLAKAAGGVDTFYLGSEMIGLTRLSSGNGVYPAVNALIALLAELRIILGPNTRLSYAADWSEYGADVRNGGQDLRFPLDPLWAHPEIGAIGVDFYPPVSDWREGTTHLDAAIAASATDPSYLLDRIGSGESYDWYYASAEDRLAQMRSPISDGAFGKPWVYRAKDLVNWWSQPHIERVNGVELSASTAFVPRSKPVILAEIGCPAVDKGANQPNMFPDAKSTESGLPFGSNGARSDITQWRLIEAMITRFDPNVVGHDPALNPISPLYNGPMVEPDSIAPWGYDVRPFPAFPMLRSQWSDGENWARGHWLNGRIEGLPLDRLIAMILADHGHDEPDLIGIEAFVDGYVIERPMSARAALQPLVSLYDVSVRLSGEGLAFLAPPKTAQLTLTRDDLVADKDGQEITLTRQQESELPRQISLAFIDGERDFRRAVVASSQLATLSRREAAEECAITTRTGEARRLIEQRLARLWAMRESARFMLKPGRRHLEPGDTIAIEIGGLTRKLRINEVQSGPTLHIEASTFDPAFAFDAPLIDDLPPEPDAPALPGAPEVMVLDLPAVSEDGQRRSVVAVHADPWNGPYAINRIEASGTLTSIGSALAPARLGETLNTLPPGPLWRWDHGASLDIRLEGGALASLSEESTLAGGNAIALIASSGAIEIIIAKNAQLIGDRRYRLSMLLRGIGGSENEAQRSLPQGARLVVIDDALVNIPNAMADLGRSLSINIAPLGRALDDPASVTQPFMAEGLALRPLAPVHARAVRQSGNISLSFIRRTRFGGDNLDLFEVPLNEEREAYTLEILAGAVVKRSFSLTAPNAIYTSAQELADFGGVQTSLSLRLTQISVSTGPGFSSQIVVPIRSV